MQEEFVKALEVYIHHLLQLAGSEAEYLREAVEIVDARNLLFRHAGEQATDEARNIYSLADLCCLDKETMAHIPNRGRIVAIARNFF